MSNFQSCYDLITKAFDKKNHKSARFLAEKMCALAGVFEMGKYNECATMFNVVVAEQNVANPYAEEMKKELIAGFQNEEDFAYMKGYKLWKKLLAKY